MGEPTYLEKLLDDAHVVWLPLRDVAILKRGTATTKKQIIVGDIPVIAGGQSPAYFHNQGNRTGTTIVIAGSGAYAGFVSYWEKSIFVSDAFSIQSNSNFLSTKYCFYWLQSIQSDLYKLQRGGGVPHVYARDVGLLQIPIPCPDNPEKSMKIQAEIIRILDKFTKLLTDLVSELNNEYNLRKKQYSFYRDKLLTFSTNSGVWLPISEIFYLKNGYTPSKRTEEFWQNGTIPWFRMEDIRQNGHVLDDSIQKISSSAVKGGTLFSANSLIMATSATIGEHALVTVPYLANQRFTNLTLRGNYVEKFNIKFLFYYCYVLAEWCKGNTSFSSFASVDMEGFRRLKIPVPSMAEQARIVAVFDKFEKLTNSISEGLLREIELRQKQYHYYRNLLFNFQNPIEQHAA